ncbi:MAG: SoxR reducing system RseC family protein [Desulfosarcina sp.]|jgi:sigma-E factor negative regulatory protein RseC
MAQTIGVVVETSHDGRATVVAEKGQGCGGCQSATHCHGGRAASSQRTPALNRAGAEVGDRVTVTVESGIILARMAVLYLVPVFAMLAGAFTGTFLFDTDGGNGRHGVALGLAGFVLGFALSVTVSRIWSAIRPVMPVITRIVNSRMISAASRPPAGCACSGK